MNVFKIQTGIVETNTYFVSSDNKTCCIIDPGDDVGKIFSALEDNALVCTNILLTHAHFDHCNACMALQKNGAKIYMHKKDLRLIKTDDNLASKFGVLFNRFKPDGYVADGQILQLGDIDVKVIATPGHTAGSCCYLIDRFLFTGDTLMHLSVGRTDFPTGNKRDMVKSLQKLVAIEGNYLIFPGHHESTNLDFEKKNNPYVQHNN